MQTAKTQVNKILYWSAAVLAFFVSIAVSQLKAPAHGAEQVLDADNYIETASLDNAPDQLPENSSSPAAGTAVGNSTQVTNENGKVTVIVNGETIPVTGGYSQRTITNQNGSQTEVKVESHGSNSTSSSVHVFTHSEVQSNEGGGP